MNTVSVTFVGTTVVSNGAAGAADVQAATCSTCGGTWPAACSYLPGTLTYQPPRLQFPHRTQELEGGQVVCLDCAIGALNYTTAGKVLL